MKSDFNLQLKEVDPEQRKLRHVNFLQENIFYIFSFNYKNDIFI